MGYRSEVGIMITIPKTKTCGEILEEISSAWDKEEFAKAFEVHELHQEKDYLFLYCDWIKWYESYDDIGATMNYINTFYDKYGKEDEECGIHFLRIGESIDDIEEVVSGEPQRWIELIRGMNPNLN